MTPNVPTSPLLRWQLDGVEIEGGIVEAGTDGDVVALRLSPADDPSDALELQVDAARVREILAAFLPGSGPAVLRSPRGLVRIEADALASDVSFDDVDAVLNAVVSKVPGARVRRVLEVEPDSLGAVKERLGILWQANSDPGVRAVAEHVYDRLPYKPETAPGSPAA